jgi:glycosyltransferase involved in cell wall biosynthesis
MSFTDPDQTRKAPPIISILMPVFNGEAYLHKTINSILSQTFQSFELLCINDCSTDGSLAVVNFYKNKDDRVKVFTTHRNLGIVPKVINFIIPNIHGEFFVYASQDDLFSGDWLEKMLSRAVETNSDAVIPDLVFYSEYRSSKLNNSRNLVGVNGDRDIIISNRRGVILSLDWTIPGNAMWKVWIIRKFPMETFGMYADEYSVRVWLLNCNKIAFCDGVFYYRIDNPNAISKKFSPKLFDYPYNCYMLYSFLAKNEFDEDVCRRQIENAIDSLYAMKELLISSGGAMENELILDADSRLFQCFMALKNARFHPGSMSGYKIFIRFQLLRVFGYNVFSTVCRGLTFIHRSGLLARKHKGCREKVDEEAALLR